MAEASIQDSPALTASSPLARKRRAEVVSEADGLRIVVYPLSYPVLLQHADAMAIVLRQLGAIDWAKLKAEGLSSEAIWWALAPLAGRQVMILVNDSCVPKLSEVEAPVDVTTEVIARWMELSFFSGGLRMIAAAAESLLSVFGAAAGKTSETTKTSPGSSALDSTAATSSTAGDTTATPDAAGPSLNSADTSVPPKES